MFVELKEDNLSEVISANDTTVVQYSAGWCGNCRIMKPKFKRFGNESSHQFVVVDAEKFPASRQLANVTNLPTFAIFKAGELVEQVQTNKTDVLKQFIDENTSN